MRLLVLFAEALVDAIRISVVCKYPSISQVIRQQLYKFCKGSFSCSELLFFTVIAKVSSKR